MKSWSLRRVVFPSYFLWQMGILRGILSLVGLYIHIDSRYTPPHNELGDFSLGFYTVFILFFSPCNWVKNLLSFPGPAQVVYNNLGMKGPGAKDLRENFLATYIEKRRGVNAGWVGNELSKTLLPLRKNSPKERQNGGLKDYIYIYAAYVCIYIYICTYTRVFMYILCVKIAMKNSRQDGSTLDVPSAGRGG